jgi:hypothetical protein
MTMRHQDDDSDGHVDGNVLAGPMSELFTVDVTGAICNCRNCEMTGPVAVLKVYAQAPGMVARCPNCDSVMLRLVRSPDGAWLDLTGTSVLHIPLPAD